MKEALTRKVGPLPTWAWVAIVGGAILVWAVFSRKKANAAANSSAATVPDTVPPVIDQFQVTSPPLQEDEDEDTSKDKDPKQGPPGPKPPIPTVIHRHDRRHHRHRRHEPEDVDTPATRTARRGTAASISGLGDQQRTGFRQGGGGRFVTVR